MKTNLLFLNVLFVLPGLMAMERTAAKELIRDSAYADTSERPRQTQAASATNAADVEKQNVGEKRLSSLEVSPNKRSRVESEKDSLETLVAKTPRQEELNKELWKALRTGLTTETIRLLEEGADCMVRNRVIGKCLKLGDTPLHVALRKRMRNAIQELIERGADITVVNESNETPLADADSDMALFAQKLISKRNKVPATEQSIASGAPLLASNQISSPNKMVAAPLGSGQSQSHVQLPAVSNPAQSTSALNKQSSVREQSGPSPAKTKRKPTTLDDDDDDVTMLLSKDRGNSVPGAARLPTPSAESPSATIALEKDLFIAAANGDIPRLKDILARGISYRMKSAEGGHTILHVAACYNRLATVQWIISTYPDLAEEISTLGSSTVLHIAARQGHFELVKWLISSCPALINKQNREKATMFHYAVASGCLPLVQYLVKECPGCVSFWTDNDSILQIAAQNGKTDVLRWLLEKFPLLRESGSIYTGATLVHAATRKNGTLDTLRFVAEVCPEMILTAERQYGLTCLHYAVWNNKPALVAWLAEKYPQLLAIKNSSGETPLDMARNKPDLVAILTRTYGKQAPSSNNTSTPVAVSSTTVPRLDQSGTAPLSASQRVLSSAVMSKLIPFVDVNRRINGRTVLDISLTQSIEFVIQLLEMGADINSQDPDGKSVLMKAIENKNDALIRLLLSRNANGALQNSAGETALILAAKQGLLPIVTLLIEKGADTKVQDRNGKNFSAYLDPSLQGLISVLLAKRS